MKLGLSTYSLDGEISSSRMTLGDVLDWIAANGGECAELVPFAYQFEKDGVIDHIMLNEACSSGCQGRGHRTGELFGAG